MILAREFTKTSQGILAEHRAVAGDVLRNCE